MSATLIGLAVAGASLWLAFRHVSRSAALAERLKRATEEADRRAASAGAIVKHLEPEDVALELKEGTF